MFIPFTNLCEMRNKKKLYLCLFNNSLWHKLETNLVPDTALQLIDCVQVHHRNSTIVGDIGIYPMDSPFEGLINLTDKTYFVFI